MKSQFFKLGWSVDVDRGAPWAQVLSATKVEAAPRCAECARRGVRFWHFEGAGHATGMSGESWADIIGGGSGPMAGPAFMVSERVVQALEAAEVTHFEAFPVEIHDIFSKRLRKAHRPEYYHLRIPPGIYVNQISVLGQPDVCSACGRPRGYFEVAKEAPRPETWNGADLFEGGNTVGPFCTDKILLMAREFRWTNFVFNPIDISRQLWRIPRSWNGIDYLGEQWPPKWYPDRPSAGKSLQQWLDEYFLEGNNRQEHDRIYDAGRALDELGEVALPSLIERFKQGSLRAAQAICSIAHRGTSVPPDVLRAAQQAVWSEDAKYNPHLFEQDEHGRLRYKNLT